MIFLVTLILSCVDDTEVLAEPWCLAGNFNGWDNTSNPLVDDGTLGDQVAGDGIYSLLYTISVTGHYEWKIVEQGNWAISFPASGNSWLNTVNENQDILFTFDTNNYSGVPGMIFLPTQNIVNCNDSPSASFTAVGDFQGWDNSNPATQMTDIGDGFYSLVYPVSTPGAYIARIVNTGSWDGFGSDGRSVNLNNIAFSTSLPNEDVTFILDYNSGRVFIGDPPVPSVPTDPAANPDTICGGGSTELTAGVGALGAVDWFTGSCGGTFVGTGSSLVVSPSVTTTFYAQQRNIINGDVSECAIVELTVQDCSAIPTLSEWGMICLSLILGGTALLVIHRKVA